VREISEIDPLEIPGFEDGTSEIMVVRKNGEEREDRALFRERDNGKLWKEKREIIGGE
jgi:hypothetical protein